MKIKKIKKKCEVRGCKNTDTYSLTNTNEFGNSVIICEECLKKAVKAVAEYDPSAEKKTVSVLPPPLFFHGGIEKTVENAEETVETEDNNTEEYPIPYTKEYLDGVKYNDLKKIAKELGINANTDKKTLIASILAF